MRCCANFLIRASEEHQIENLEMARAEFGNQFISGVGRMTTTGKASYRVDGIAAQQFQDHPGDDGWLIGLREEGYCPQGLGLLYNELIPSRAEHCYPGFWKSLLKLPQALQTAAILHVHVEQYEPDAGMFFVDIYGLLQAIRLVDFNVRMFSSQQCSQAESKQCMVVDNEHARMLRRAVKAT